MSCWLVSWDHDDPCISNDDDDYENPVVSHIGWMPCIAFMIITRIMIIIMKIMMIYICWLDALCSFDDADDDDDYDDDDDDYDAADVIYNEVV